MTHSTPRGKHLILGRLYNSLPISINYCQEPINPVACCWKCMLRISRYDAGVVVAVESSGFNQQHSSFQFLGARSDPSAGLCSCKTDGRCSTESLSVIDAVSIRVRASGVDPFSEDMICIPVLCVGCGSLCCWLGWHNCVRRP